MSQHFLTFCQCYSLEICSFVRPSVRLSPSNSTLLSLVSVSSFYLFWWKSVIFFDVDRTSSWPLNCLIFYSGRIHISVTEQFICICHQLLQITFVHVWFGGLARWIGFCVFSRPGPFPFATPVLRHFGLICLPEWLRFAQYHIHVVPLC